MDDSRDFDLLTSPCEGTSLIEASAGTGKTYAITGLALRLILEKKLPINEILVVTFTEAATNELKDRIRRRLREALAWFAGGTTQDSLLAELCRRQPDAAAAARQLQFAINDFDQASIFTIHGFCMRVLRDHAFASGMMFDAELVTDQDVFVREIVYDFWRRHFYRASPLFLNYALNKGVSPESLHAMVGKNLTNPYLKIIPQHEIPDCSEQEAAFLNHFQEVFQAWPAAREEVEHLLATTDALNRNRYKQDSIPGWIEAVDTYLASEGQDCTLPDAFPKFTSEAIQAAVKKNCKPPEHPFFFLCDRLQEAQQQLVEGYDQMLLGLRFEFITTMRSELTKRKLSKNTLFYDDLLLMLERALSGPGGEDLAAIVRNRYQAALIDEFQDTDAIQYAIFERIFGQGRSTLFLIGDPKQAIYGFRGADIFAYLEASRQASRRFTLGENWRSEPALIAAVNTVFSQAENSFVYEEIAFRPVQPARNKQHDLLTLEGKPAAPLQIWFMDSGEITEGQPIPRGVAQEVVPGAVAGEISRLLTLSGQNQAMLENRPLQQGDIAVLVRRNAEARLVQAALADLGIHAVLYNIGNLFDTAEALELERLLAAIADPSEARIIKLALVTEMLGANGEELDRLIREEAAWEMWLIRFGEYHELWNRHGFFRMFRRLLSQESVLPRLMSLLDGERRCTNVLHLAEVLHQAAVDNNLSMVGLVKWLSAQRDPAAPRLEEHQLRLESDENAVKIVTIHKSKGMEYPIVFCPFIGDSSKLRTKDGVFTFHDEADGLRLTLDLGSSQRDEHVRLAEKEQLAESLRLLYVAMTRAKHRCTLVWGRLRDAGTAAPAYLFHQPREDTAKDLPDAVSTRYTASGDEDLWRDLDNLQGKAHESIALLPIPLAPGKRQPAPDKGFLELRQRPFRGSINRDWRISSFSSLVSNQPRMADWADRDEPAIAEVAGREEERGAPAAAREARDMFSFPRGTAAGILLHEVFEHLDFTERDETVMHEVIAGRLNAHGFESYWLGPVSTMVRKVLEMPLDSNAGSLRLAQVPLADRLNELEFYFPLQRLSESRLKEVFERCLGDTRMAGLPSSVERLQFKPLEGFMKGFMDLVFHFEGRYYLVDWKSNFLGGRIEDYARGALQKVMTESFYQLQYHLYVVAIHKYLAARLPGYRYDSHFGGVYYIFLRGVDPDKGSDYGIYRHRPAAASIEALCTNLIGTVAP